MVSFIVRRRNSSLEINLEEFWSDILSLMEIYGKLYKLCMGYGSGGKDKTILEVDVNRRDAFLFYNMINFMEKYSLEQPQRIVLY